MAGLFAGIVGGGLAGFGKGLAEEAKTAGEELREQRRAELQHKYRLAEGEAAHGLRLKEGEVSHGYRKVEAEHTSTLTEGRDERNDARDHRNKLGEIAATGRESRATKKAGDDEVDPATGLTPSDTRVIAGIARFHGDGTPGYQDAIRTHSNARIRATAAGDTGGPRALTSNDRGEFDLLKKTNTNANTEQVDWQGVRDTLVRRNRPDMLDLIPAGEVQALARRKAEQEAAGKSGFLGIGSDYGTGADGKATSRADYVEARAKEIEAEFYGQGAPATSGRGLLGGAGNAPPPANPPANPPAGDKPPADAKADATPTADAKPKDEGKPAAKADEGKPAEKKVDAADALAQAKAAIAKGADRDAVIARLKKLGIEPKGL